MISADRKITVFHYNKDEETKLCFGKVSIYEDISAKVSDIDILPGANVKVRIFTKKDICVSVGDRVVLREVFEGENISFEETFTVVRVKNNVRGSGRVSHYLLYLS